MNIFTIFLFDDVEKFFVHREIWESLREIYRTMIIRQFRHNAKDRGSNVRQFRHDICLLQRNEENQISIGFAKNHLKENGTNLVISFANRNNMKQILLFIGVVLLGSTATAQEGIRKEVRYEDQNGVKTVIVTTDRNGLKSEERFVGADADRVMNEMKVKDQKESATHKKVQRIDKSGMVVNRSLPTARRAAAQPQRVVGQ